MATSMKTLLLLGLVVASFGVAAEATTYHKHGTDVDLDLNLNVKVALQLNLKKCSSAVKVFIGADVKVCAGGALTVLNPLVVKLDVPHLLAVYVQIDGGVKVKVIVDLGKVKVIGGIHHVVLDLVEDTRTKKVEVLCLGVKLTVLDLLKLKIGLNL